jgi:hypothetical protein
MLYYYKHHQGGQLVTFGDGSSRKTACSNGTPYYARNTMGTAVSSALPYILSWKARFCSHSILQVPAP